MCVVVPTTRRFSNILVVAGAGDEKAMRWIVQEMHTQEIGMNKAQLKGRVEQVKGKIKQVTGSVVGRRWNKKEESKRSSAKRRPVLGI